MFHITSHQENANWHHWPLGKCQRKPQWILTTYLSQWLKFETTTIPNAGENGETALPFTVKSSAVSKKLNIHLPYDPKIELLGIYPTERKTDIHTRMWTRLLTAALSVIVPNWKYLKRPSVSKRFDQLWHIDTMKSYSGLRRTRYWDTQ